jgi:putative DNA primase/helicase
MSRTVEAARGRWFGLLRHFGVDERYLRNRHGPCPLCGGKDRYRWDDKDGSGSYYCGQCGAGSGMQLLMRYTGMDFREAAAAVDELIGSVQKVEPKQKTDPRVRLRKINAGLQSVEGINPVRVYLRSRGLSPAEATQYNPSVAYYDGGFVGSFPAMVHLFSGQFGEPLTYHITYLDKCGRKASVESPRKVLTPVSPLAGGAIRLCGCEDMLGIAEGVETALAATKLMGVPCWAAYSATLMESFIPPECVRKLIVFGDNDSTFTGQKAAYTLANKMERAGLSVEVRIPDRVDTDWADEVAA